MEDQELKMQCLGLACGGGVTPDTVTYARQFYDFVKGTNDAEIIRAAHALAGKVNAKA